MAMKYLAVLLLLFITIITIHAQTTLDRAEEAYRLRDYLTAITLYEEAIDSGQHDSTTFYNLGNAYYEAENLGQAMLNYRRALLYLPRDTNLNINIARIRAQRSTITTSETDWLNQLATLSNDTFTLFELSLLIFVGWIVFFVILAIDVVRGFHDGNTRLFVVVMGIILLIGLVLMGSRLYVETQRPTAVVLSNSVNVMSGPGEDYLSIYTIHAAAEVRIMEEVDDWLRFALPDGRGGWLQRQYVGFVIN
ncbi:MAG: hypothetical protein Q9P01_09780 [Anaerolineae bacterium]|nr:hypothetical protein [Anaerolineae bacterium]MDQ7035104.1 hypothetical protein [Anaerolineae bacterium]